MAKPEILKYVQFLSAMQICYDLVINVVFIYLLKYMLCCKLKKNVSSWRLLLKDYKDLSLSFVIHRATKICDILMMLFFFLFKAKPASYGSSQPRGGIGDGTAGPHQATATQDLSHICDLCCICGNARSITH